MQCQKLATERSGKAAEEERAFALPGVTKKSTQLGFSFGRRHRSPPRRQALEGDKARPCPLGPGGRQGSPVERAANCSGSQVSNGVTNASGTISEG